MASPSNVEAAARATVVQPCDADHRVAFPTSAKAAAPRCRAAWPTRSGAVPGVRLLDHSSDASHNRSVFTLAGDADARQARDARDVRAGAVPPSICAASGRASPPRRGRRGPLRPDRGGDDGGLRRAGEGRGRRRSPNGSDVPVYLYEEASANPARQEPRRHPARRVRGAGGEDGAGRTGRRTSARRRPTRPPAPRSIGARMPLIAYNINLAHRPARRRQEDRRRHPPQQRRPALRQGDGVRARGSRHRAGVDEPDELREDADLPRLRHWCGARPRATASTCSRARSSAWCRQRRWCRRPSTTCSSNGSAPRRFSRTRLRGD